MEHAVPASRPPELSEARGEFGRLAQIAKVAAGKGWSHYAARLAVAAASSTPTSAESEQDAVRLREALEELGPTFIKFGQAMAERPDIFPPGVTAELAKLHDAAEPFAAKVARDIIQRETSKRIEDLYASFEDNPLAAASMAQVHCAMLHDGTAVVVKVQRPDIAADVEADIAVLRRVASLAGSLVPSLRAFSLPDLVDEVAETLRGELDFEQEARNAERFAALHADEPSVFVPKVFWEATTRRIMTMERSPGRRLDAGAHDAERNKAAASLLMRLFLTQVFEHGVFHGDPHPGNVFILDDGRICFHDFGALGELSPQLKGSLRELFLGVVARDPGWVASAYLAMGGGAPEVDRALFAKDVGVALDRYYHRSGGGVETLSAVMHEFVRLGRRHHIRLLRETALLVRAFAELESLVRQLDPQFSSVRAFDSYSVRLLTHALVPQLGVARFAEMYRATLAIGDIVGKGPTEMRRLLGRLERGEPLFEIRHQSGGSLERHLLHASNRLAFALIIASMVTGSAIVMSAHVGPHLGDVPLIALVGFVVAGALGLAWAVLALKSGKL